MRGRVEASRVFAMWNERVGEFWKLRAYSERLSCGRWMRLVPGPKKCTCELY